jgi:hypothetical protein
VHNTNLADPKGYQSDIRALESRQMRKCIEAALQMG